MTILLFFVITGCSAIGVGLMRLYTLKMHLVDIPNQRSSHQVPTPRGGGAVIVLFFLAGGLLLAFSGTLPWHIFSRGGLCGILIALIGYLDDHRNVAAGIRLCIHFTAACAAVFFLQSVPVIPWFGEELAFGTGGQVLAVFFLVWLLNLYNFMDGIDGLAGVETLCVAFGAAIILSMSREDLGVVQWLLVLSAATLGFLVWNWPPAKIFMGDVGSGFVGFVLGCFAVLTSGQQGINIWTWLILLAVFIVDATVTLVRRLLRKERFWQAHRSHAYQILSRRYNSHTRVTVGVLLINVTWLLPCAIISARLPSYAFLCVLAAVLPLIVLAVKVGAGTTND